MKNKISAGSSVYAKSPQSLIPDCVSITGDVVSVRRRRGIWWATLDGYVAKVGGCYRINITIRSECLGHRIGTPISQLSGRPGCPGYAEFARIANSWGYP